MLNSFFKPTFRSLWKNKGYSFLNIAGLGIGIACAALIFLWVEDEVNFNQNFAKKDYLYKVFSNHTYQGKVVTFRATSGPLAKALKAEVPGIKNTARLSFNQNFTQLFSLGDKATNEQGYYADSSVFSILAIPFVHGSAAGAFNQLYSVVISEKLSEKFFGNTDPVGKTIKVNNERDFIVSGVFKNLPQNSSFQFQWLAPFELFETKNSWLSGWGNNGVNTLVELKPGIAAAAVNKRLAGFLGTHQKDMANTPCLLYAMNDWHLKTFEDGKMVDGQVKYVRLFSIIAWVILFIACINFMNLATARSEKKAREVGVRKVMGAGKGGLIRQFISEALTMSYMAVLLAVLIVVVVLPGFNMLVEKQLSLNLLSPLHFTALLAIGFICGITAGSYPAFYLSSFKPVAVLKGIKLKTSGGAVFIRKGLVVIQFAISTVLIICTAIIYQQVKHVKQRDLGYNKDNIIYINLQGNLQSHFEAVRNSLLMTGMVENAALSADQLLVVGSSTDGVEWQGKDPNKHVMVSMENVSPQYITTMGMQLVQGRDFYDTPKADSASVIINEALAKQMGKAGAIGSTISVWGGNYKVTGIAKNFVYNDMYEPAEPVLLACQPENTNVLSIRYKAGVDITKALAQTESIIKTANPGYPFDYKFVDDDFGRLFKTETLIENLAGVFAMLAIFISCLGLFGLSAYMAERRVKEIGIRKTLGASISGITGLLSKDFLKLVFIANIIAFPLAWWYMYGWLQNYAYRVSINWWVFIAAAGSAMFIAMATISFQTIKAALANPVRSLKSE